MQLKVVIVIQGRWLMAGMMKMVVVDYFSLVISKTDNYRKSFKLVDGLLLTLFMDGS